jgi:hypothetical protein
VRLDAPPLLLSAKLHCRAGPTVGFPAGGPPSNRAIYRRPKDEGKPDKVARIAAGRKLLLLAHAIYNNCDPFRPVAGMHARSSAGTP